METQLLWFKNKLDSPPALPARNDFDWPTRENRGSLTLQWETNKELGSRPASERTSPFQTLNGLIGRLLSFSRRESSLNTLLEGHCSVTVIHNLISGSRFRKAANWESLMKCLVTTGRWGFYQERTDSSLKPESKCKPFSAQRGDWIHQLAIYIEHWLELFHIHLWMAWNRKGKTEKIYDESVANAKDWQRERPE